MLTVIVRQSVPPLKGDSPYLEEDEGTRKKECVVVIGNGMVLQPFMENLIKTMNKNKIDRLTCLISTFCEVPQVAYNRVKLMSYFETCDPSALSMTLDYDKEGKTTWFKVNDVQLL